MNTAMSVATVPLSLVIIPTWLQSVLQAENLGWEVATDIDTLAGIVSREDLAAYLYLNLYPGRWVGDPTAMSFQSPAFVTEYLDQNPGIISLITSHQITQASEKISGRSTAELFGPLDEPFSPEWVEYKVLALSNNTVAVFPMRSQTPYMDKVSLLDDLLYVANTHMSMEGLAKLPMFRYFLSIV